MHSLLYRDKVLSEDAFLCTGNGIRLTVFRIRNTYNTYRIYVIVIRSYFVYAIRLYVIVITTVFRIRNTYNTRYRIYVYDVLDKTRNCPRKTALSCQKAVNTFMVYHYYDHKSDTFYVIKLNSCDQLVHWLCKVVSTIRIQSVLLKYSSCTSLLYNR